MRYYSCSLSLLQSAAIAITVLTLIVRVKAPGVPTDCYNLPTGFTWAKWKQYSGTLTAQDVDLPASTILQSGAAHIIDIAPEPLDPTRIAYRMFIYRREAPPAPTEPGPSDLWGWLQILKKKKPEELYVEGPWCIRPADLLNDAIRPKMQSEAEVPRWVRDLSSRRFREVHEFRVDKVGPLYRLLPIPSGKLWILGRLPESGVAPPTSLFVTNGVPFAIHSIVDKTDLERRTRLFMLYSIDRGGHNGIYEEGPWRVRPASQYDVVRGIRGSDQPRWALGRYTTRTSPELMDFMIVTGPDRDKKAQELEHQRILEEPIYQYIGPDGVLDRSNVLVKKFQTQCMVQTLFQLLPETQTIIEMGVIQGEANIVSSATEEPEDEDQLPYGIAESIQARIEGLDRPIAQTVHTDHLDFRFDVPGDRPELSLLTMLYICATAGRDDLQLAVNPKSDL